MARQCFYSFYFHEDNWRAAKVRNIGTVEGNKPAPGNTWEIVKKAGDEAIKRWIAAQMKEKSCVIVLVGTNTSTRKWVKHEIIKGWDDGLGVVGINIHGLKDVNGYVSRKGQNPFSIIGWGYRKTIIFNCEML